ncbi:hypothetical protein HK104_003607 [Borealophlyctis nickersoniae]|nr:hypothetical protein HK104_003607 [Borealophlyctis nickersoniae]
MKGTCNVCQQPAPQVCSACKSVSYCSKDHQKADWKTHKLSCSGAKKPKPKPTAASLLPGLPPAPDSWAKGLSPEQAAEWFVDCFRMRMDDDYALTGGDRHGYYTLSPYHAVREFLVFARLAVKHKIVPKDFNWKLCLGKAGELIPFAFEKSDAQEKYGSENVFAVVQGGRSLRFTGEAVYASGVMEHDQSEAYTRIAEEVENGEVNMLKNPRLFEEVGGVKEWGALFHKVRELKSRMWVELLYHQMCGDSKHSSPHAPSFAGLVRAIFSQKRGPVS